METFDGAPAPSNPMDPAEVLARASAFDPTSVDPAKVMRLALQMIVAMPHLPSGEHPLMTLDQYLIYTQGLNHGMEKASRIAYMALAEVGE